MTSMPISAHSRPRLHVENTSDSEEDCLNLSTSPVSSSVALEGTVPRTKTFNGTDNLLSDLKTLMSDEPTADVKFTTKDSTKPIFGHKLILALRSEVFKTMFFGNMRESKAEIAEVEVPDLSTECFKSFMEFMYCGTIEITADNVLELMYVSHKYRVISLQTACASYVQSHVSSETAILILKTALLLDDQELVTMCMKKIEHEIADAIEQSSFLELSKAELLILVKNNDLNVDELVLFRRVVDWCNSSKISKEEAEEIMQHIRFGAFSGQELLQFVKPCQMVNRELYYEALEKQFANHKEPKSRKAHGRRTIFKH